MKKTTATTLRISMAALLAASCGTASRFGENARLDGVHAPGKSSGSSDETAAPSGGKTPEPDGTDVPVWVNGSYLTCAWTAADETPSLSIGCRVANADGSLVLLPAGTAVRWSISTVDGGPLSAASVQENPNNPTAVEITLLARDVPGTVVTAMLPGALSAGTKARPLDEALPGFAGSGGLAACLEGGSAPLACLTEAGVQPAGSPLVEPVKPAEPPPASSLPRSLYNNVPYYLGDDGASCTETCADLGGIDNATYTVIGSDGVPEECGAVAMLLSPRSGFVSSDPAVAGVGCSVDTNGQGHHVYTPVTTAGAKASGYRRICACAR